MNCSSIQCIEVECEVRMVSAGDLAALENVRKATEGYANDALKSAQLAQLESEAASDSAKTANEHRLQAEGAASRALHSSIDAKEQADLSEQFSQQSALESQNAQQFANEAGEQAKKAAASAEAATMGGQYAEEAKRYRDEASDHADRSEQAADRSGQFAEAAAASEAGVQEDADLAGEYALKAENEANAALKEAENARGYVKHCEHIARLLEQLLKDVDFEYWVGELTHYVESARASAEKAEQQATLAQQLADAAKVSQDASEVSRLASEAAQAKAEAAQAASEAAAAATKISETNAALSETNAAISENNASDSASSAAESAGNAAESLSGSVAAKDAAAISAQQAAESAVSANDYSQSAGQSSESAAQSASEAEQSAAQAAISESQATASAAAAEASEQAVDTAHADIVIRHEDIIARQQNVNDVVATGITTIRNEGTTQVNRVIAEGDKYTDQLGVIADAVEADAGRAETAADRAEEASEKAQEAANTVTGYYQDGGGYDASGGVLPAIPDSSTIWRIVQGGTLDGIAYGIGDSLLYSTVTDSFYKIDNTESVYSVNGYHGVVSLTHTDVNALPDTSTVTDLGGYTVAQVDQLARDIRQELTSYQSSNNAAVSDLDQDLQSYKSTNDIAVQHAQSTADSKLSDALQDGKQYVRRDGQWVEVTVDVNEAPVDGRQYVRKNGQWVAANAPLNWSAPLAVAGQVIINPPYEFDECNVYINGVMQDQERGAFVIVDNRIELGDALSEGDHVQVVIGANPPSVRMTEAPQAGQWNTVTSSVHVLNGDHLLLDSSDGTFTITLPESPNPGERIEFLEVGDMAEINPIMLNGNGLLIMGHSTQQLETNGLSFSLLYTDPYGWRLIE